MLGVWWVMRWVEEGMRYRWGGRGEWEPKTPPLPRSPNGVVHSSWGPYARTLQPMYKLYKPCTNRPTNCLKNVYKLYKP